MANPEALAGDDPNAAAQATLGATHSFLGAYLLGTWGLPMGVVEAVAFQSNPTLVEHDSIEVLTAVHIAAALAGNEDAYQLDEKYVDSMGLAPDVESWRELEAEADDHGREAA